MSNDQWTRVDDPTTHKFRKGDEVKVEHIATVEGASHDYVNIGGNNSIRPSQLNSSGGVTTLYVKTRPLPKDRPFVGRLGRPEGDHIRIISWDRNRQGWYYLDGPWGGMTHRVQRPDQIQFVRDIDLSEES